MSYYKLPPERIYGDSSKVEPPSGVWDQPRVLAQTILEKLKGVYNQPPPEQVTAADAAGMAMDLVNPLMTKARQGIKVVHGTTAKFRHHNPNLVGTANPYTEHTGRLGKAIYFEEDARVARGWATTPGVRSEDVILRKHNIPGWAKIADLNQSLDKAGTERLLRQLEEIDPGMVHSYRRKVARIGEPSIATTGSLLEHVGYNSTDFDKVLPMLGYDGAKVKLLGGRAREYAIYNYDVINNPTRVEVERGLRKTLGE